MKILFALSQVEVTGAETYAMTLGSVLKRLGHEILFVSEKLRDARSVPFRSLPLHTLNSSYPGRIRNILSLRRILKEEKIELIHSHSRAANLVCHFARWRCRPAGSSRWDLRQGWRAGKKPIPMVVTVHGRWRSHFAARALPLLGERTIAVCPYLERYLLEDLGAARERVSMIPNGIDLTQFPGKGNPNGAQALFIGRFSGQKGKAIRFLIKEVFPELFAAVPGLALTVAGGRAPEEDKALARRLNASLGREAVRLIENDVIPSHLYPSASVVIGSGRVALEALASGRPVVAIGESSAPGLLREENFGAAFDSNFGDCGEWNLFEKDKERLQKDILSVLRGERAAETLGLWGRGKVEERFDARKVAAEVEALYRQVMTG